MSKKPKRPRDPNKLGKFIVDIAIGKKKDSIDNKKNKANVETGRIGGLKGGKARAMKLSPKKRSEIARKAAQKRWKKN